MYEYNACSQTDMQRKIVTRFFSHSFRRSLRPYNKLKINTLICNYVKLIKNDTLRLTKAVLIMRRYMPVVFCLCTFVTLLWNNPCLKCRFGRLDANR